MSKYEIGGDMDPTGDELELKVKKLQEATNALREIVSQVRLEKESASESEHVALDAEIKRYEEAISINEKEMEQLSKDLLSRLRSDGTVN